MRTSKKEAKQQNLGEDTFILPSFKPLPQVDQNMDDPNPDLQSSSNVEK